MVTHNQRLYKKELASGIVGIKEDKREKLKKKLKKKNVDFECHEYEA